MLQAIINSLAINEDGVLVSGADNGSIWFWDYKSGNVFQEQETIAQPGSLESEQGETCCAISDTPRQLEGVHQSNVAALAIVSQSLSHHPPIKAYTRWP